MKRNVNFFPTTAGNRTLAPRVGERHHNQYATDEVKSFTQQRYQLLSTRIAPDVIYHPMEDFTCETPSHSQLFGFHLIYPNLLQTKMNNIM